MDSINNNGNGWNDHKLLVQSSLKELKQDVKDIRDGLSSLKEEVAVMKVKLAFIMTGVGVAVTTVMNIIFYFMKGQG